MPDLSSLISRHLPAAGLIDTALDGVQLFRVDAPIARVGAVYPPSLCLIVQGEKRAYLHGDTPAFGGAFASRADRLEGAVPVAVLSVTFREAGPTPGLARVDLGRSEEPVTSQAGLTHPGVDVPREDRVLRIVRFESVATHVE